jgi:hypothetical protein
VVGRAGRATPVVLECPREAELPERCPPQLRPWGEVVGDRRLRVVRETAPPPASISDRRRSRRLWGLGVEAQANLSQGMQLLLEALDHMDADDPEAVERVADTRWWFAQTIGKVERLLDELVRMADETN